MATDTLTPAQNQTWRDLCAIACEAHGHDWSLDPPDEDNDPDLLSVCHRCEAERRCSDTGHEFVEDNPIYGECSRCKCETIAGCLCACGHRASDMSNNSDVCFDCEPYLSAPSKL